MHIALLAVCFVLGVVMFWLGLRRRKRPALDSKGNPLSPKRAQLLIAMGVAFILVTGLLLLIFVPGELLLGE
jgi:uncharacterized iron-regulated membrane protein